jgi:nuclear transport factor 2 (NTF2) superfamily protein
MYIEFDLLPDVHMAPNHGAAVRLSLIMSEMNSWGHRHGILHYREKTIKYKHRVTFDQDQTYSFWAMTWNPEQNKILAQYCIVSDLNNKI